MKTSSIPLPALAAPRACIGALLLAALPLTALADRGNGNGNNTTCSVSTLRGSYAYSVTGALTSGPFAGPFAAVGRFNFDGVGTFQNVRTISRNGTILPSVAGTGTYTLKTDCTGSITFTDGGVVTLATDVVVEDNGDGIRMIATSAGTVLVVTGRKQFPR